MNIFKCLFNNNIGNSNNTNIDINTAVKDVPNDVHEKTKKAAQNAFAILRNAIYGVLSGAAFGLAGGMAYGATVTLLTGGTAGIIIPVSMLVCVIAGVTIGGVNGAFAQYRENKSY